MEKQKIDRINELARKQREIGLTEEEKSEQAILRKEYIESWRKGVKQTLDNTYIVDKNGNKTKLKEKREDLDN